MLESLRKLNLNLEIIIICLFALFAVFKLTQATTQLPLKDSNPFASNEKELGAIASENVICTNIGVELLKAGGNAADAMVGTVLCVGTISMYHSGLGGGGFMLVRSSNATYEAIDFREKAPQAAFQDMYVGNLNASIRGGLASGVPGQLQGLAYLHEHYGLLPWSKVVQPAINLARDGFIISHDLASVMDFETKDYDFLINDPSWAMDFAPNGKRLGLGDRLTRVRYAETLQKIADDGVDAFYTGEIANATITAIKAANGIMTMKDLQDYAVVSRPVYDIEYRGFRIYTCGAPSSGAVGLNILKTVEGYEDFGDEDMLNLSTHRLDEAIRFAYGKRASLGDPDFVENIRAYEKDMLDGTSTSTTRSKISDLHTQNVSAYDPSGFESLETHGTSHIVAADTSGLAISLTTTINLYFGSHLIVPETGVILNSEMCDFSTPNASNPFGYHPSPSNFIFPGKRPLSSITPLIIENAATKRLHSLLGAAGGSRIITATIQAAINMLDRNMSMHDALKQPRAHDQLVPNQVTFEYAFDNSTVEFMRGRGHEICWVPPGYSSVQGLRVLEDGVWEAAAEPRQRDSKGVVAFGGGMTG